MSTQVQVGGPEILVLLALGAGGLVAIVIAGIVLFFVARSNGRSSRSQFRLGEPAGSPTRVRLFQPADLPLAPSARWDGDELLVHAEAWSTKSLFDLPLKQAEQCQLTYRFRIKTDNVRRAVYPELWCRIPEKGQFFSRGVDRKIRGTQDWIPVEVPFYLQSGQRADLLHLNLVFESAGTARLKDIEVLVTPLKP